MKRRSRAAWSAIALALLLTACASPPPRDPALQPELATASRDKPLQRFAREAIVAAHPLAAEAGARLLRAGGSALDAAIAAQWVLGLVEPQSSGIGGGGFLLHWDGRQVQAYDGRETAPAAADDKLLLDAAGTPLPFEAAAVGGRAVGAPGLVAMLELAHRRHGRVAWARLFEPAIALAESGFPVGERLHALLQSEATLQRDPVARRFYYRDDGRPLPVGTLLRNPDYAAALRQIARHGAQALRAGPLAEAIVTAVRGHAANPGRLAVDDLAGYQALEREPLCHDWRRWRLCGMPPPSSGALVIAQVLALLDRTTADGPSVEAGLPSADFLHRYSEAARLAYADRNQYIADPAFVAAPGGRWDRLLAPDYLDARGRSIGARSMGQAVPGEPAPTAAHRSAQVDAGSPELPATTHLSIVDAEGRAVALTSSIEAQFGARVMVNRGEGLAGGFLLNNQLTDFSFAPRAGNGAPIANRVQPGKRPRSSMAPTLVFERASGRLVMVAGSPGGAPIPLYVAKAVWAVLDRGFDPQAAVALPNFGSVNGPTLLETGRFDAATRAALEARGHLLRDAPLTSGSHVLWWDGSGWQAGADPRRDGAAAGR